MPRSHERQRSQDDTADAAIRDQEQNDHADVSARPIVCTSALVRSSMSGERARTAHRHRHVRRRSRRERCAEPLERRALSAGIERRCTRLHEQQRARSVVVEPNVELAAGLLSRKPALQNFEQLERRIARQPWLEEESGGRL
jgi:hypothetical protein